MKAKRPSSPRASHAITDALANVQDAQALLARACQRLSSIRAGADLYKKVGKAHDGIHALWYVIDKARTRPGMSVDSECERCHTDLSTWRTGDPTHRCAGGPS